MVATFVKKPSVIEQAIVIEQQQAAAQKRTGIVRVEQTIEEKQLTERFHTLIKVFSEVKHRKLTQCEKMVLFLDLKEQRRITYTSKHVALAEMLACYHGWPRHLCAIQPSSGLYSYNMGRKIDRAYCAIETEMVAWLQQ